MKGITKATFLTLFSGECLDWLQVEVVVKMQIVQVLPVDEQVEHVVALTTHLETCLHPVQLSGLEKLGGLERAEKKPEWQISDRVKLAEQTNIYRLFRALGGLCLRAFRTKHLSSFW